MSCEIFLQCWRDKLSVALDWPEFEQVFGPYIDHREPGFMQLKFPDGEEGQGDIYFSRRDPCSGFTIGNYGGIDLLKALITFAVRTDSTIFTTWDLMVTKEENIADIPDDVISALGAPKVVTNVDEFMKA